MSSFEFVDSVTSDVSFAARGRTLEELLTAAADALIAATIERPAALEARERRSLELDAPEADLLLLRFLNELIYLRDADGLLLRPSRLSVEHPDGLRLRATLEGEPIDRERHGLAGEPKAATAHGLAVQRGDDGWSASFTLDV